MELTMKPSAKFWDKIAERYARRPISDKPTYQRKLEITRQYLDPDMQALEIGCGTGGTALAHAPHVKHILATDLSERMIEIARHKQTDSGIENVTFEVTSIEELSVPDGSLDAVLAMSVLHLLNDERAAVDKIHRLLKPGGIFVSSTTCLGDHLKIFKYIEPLGRALGLMPAVNVFTTSHLMRVITDSGFHIEHRWEPGKNKARFIVARK